MMNAKTLFAILVLASLCKFIKENNRPMENDWKLN